jgi:hypothetical protein
VTINGATVAPNGSFGAGSKIGGVNVAELCEHDGVLPVK